MKRLFLLSIMVSVAAIAEAQIQFGIKGGLNLSNVRRRPAISAISYSVKPGFYTGGLICIPLPGHFSLQAEVVYSVEGTKIKSNAYASSYNTDYWFLNIPLLFKYKNPSGFFAEIGPQISFLADAKNYPNGISMDTKKYYRSANLSGVAGIGYLSSLNIGIDARYNLGLTNTAKASNASSTGRVIQVGVFYMFGGNKK